MVSGEQKSTTSSAEFTLSVAVGPIADRRVLTSSFALPAAAAGLPVADRLPLTPDLLLRTARFALLVAAFPNTNRRVRITGMGVSTAAARLACDSSCVPASPALSLVPPQALRCIGRHNLCVLDAASSAVPQVREPPQISNVHSPPYI